MSGEKFRAWDTEAKCYIKDPVLVDNFGNVYVVCEEPSNKKGTCLITGKPNVILERDTGLKDMNGEEICEGDIVQCGAYKGKVHYSVGVACYCVGDYTPIYQISRIENESFITLKVIGNIHESDMEEK